MSNDINPELDKKLNAEVARFKAAISELIKQELKEGEPTIEMNLTVSGSNFEAKDAALRGPRYVCPCPTNPSVCCFVF
jgi:hypothetical protein